MTVLDWDYSALAAHYNRRAPYADNAIDGFIQALQLPIAAMVADIGAGTGRLSLPLLARGLRVTAVEPNARMRAVGLAQADASLHYVDAPGEATGLTGGAFDLVSYGSSFNVVEPTAALAEAARLLHDDGAIALLWNHRDLDDPLQHAIEEVIRRHIPDYGYGSRRDDPTGHIQQSGLFGEVGCLQYAFVHHTTRADFLDGFRAHATLLRQAGTARAVILADIDAVLDGCDTLAVPFCTRVWYARRHRG